jgi:hypothetical protein
MVLTEGKLQFTFPGEKAIKFDDTEFYRQRFNKLSGAKGVDFICDTDNKKEWQHFKLKRCHSVRTA